MHHTGECKEKSDMKNSPTKKNKHQLFCRHKEKAMIMNSECFLTYLLCSGYDMSTFIRRYGRYLNEKAFAYRQMAFDFTRVKKGYVEHAVQRTCACGRLKSRQLFLHPMFSLHILSALMA